MISDIFGVSLEALIAGQRSPTALAQLAQLAQGTMRSKTAVLQEALTGTSKTTTGSCCRRCWITSTR